MVLNVRNVMGWLLAEMMIKTGVVQRRIQGLLQKEYILSIYFHKPAKKEFEYCIKWLKKKGFRFLSVADVDRIIQRNLPWPKGSVVVTVDDGWQSNEKNIVEVAGFYEVPVTIFVATAPVEEGAFWWSYAYAAQKRKVTSLSVEQIKKLPNGKRL